MNIFLVVSILESVNENSLFDIFVTSTVLIFEVIPSSDISHTSILSPSSISKSFNCNVTLLLYILISVISYSVFILSICPYVVFTKLGAMFLTSCAINPYF